MEIFTSTTATEPPRQDTDAAADSVKVDTSIESTSEHHIRVIHDGQASDICDAEVEEEPDAKRAKVDDDVKQPQTHATDDVSAVSSSLSATVNATATQVQAGDSDVKAPRPISTEETSLTEPTSAEMKPSTPASNKNSMSWILANESTTTTAPTIEALMERFRLERTSFLENLKVNDRVDIKCYKYRQWFAAKVVKVTDKAIKIHFNGFKQEVNYDKDDFMHIAPEGTYVEPYDPSLGSKWKPKPSAMDVDLGGLTYIPEKKPKKNPAPKRARPTPPNKDAIAGEVIKKSVSRSRATPLVDPNAVKKEPPTADELAAAVKKAPAKRPKTEPKPVPSDPFEAKGINRDELPLWLSSTSTVKPTGDFQADLDREQEVCSACLEVEDADGTDYLLCDGGCLGSYHRGCVGLSSDAELPDVWKCDNCARQEHECLICHELGIVGEALVKCALMDCGKYYHPECLILHPHTQVGLKNKTLVCPRHTCDNCYGKKGSEGLMKCAYCTKAYHPRCIPPSCRFTNAAMVCGWDKAKKLPSIPDFYGPNKVVFDGKFKFPDIFLPKLPPSEGGATDDALAAVELKLQKFQFRLPLAFLDDSNAPPPRFQKLRRNQYQFKPIKLDMNDLPMCQCKDKCDDDCTNRASFVECIGHAGNADNKEKYFNCRVGPDCGNRALQIAAIPKTKVFKTNNGRGFGLRVLEPVKAGALVIEYVGEVITAWMKQDRMIEHAKTSPNDPNYYIMELDKNVYLDGRVKGSDSRFINHSCEPNCHLLKWEVGEYKRIAITALRDIEADEELSYDYQMETQSTDSFKCHCGAPRCRGTMAPDNLNKEAHAKLQMEEDKAKKSDKKKATKKRKRATAKPAMADAVEPPTYTSTSSRRGLASAEVQPEGDAKPEEGDDVKSEEATTTDETKSPASSDSQDAPDAVPKESTPVSTTSVQEVSSVKAEVADTCPETSDEDASPTRPSGEVEDTPVVSAAPVEPTDVKPEAAVAGEVPEASTTPSTTL